MTRKIFINLPVRDIERSKIFFANLGFSFDPQFTDEQAACLVIGENIYAMLLREDFFATFTQKPISDAMQSTEVLIAIDVESREAVDDMVHIAEVSGGVVYNDPQDHGWMYQHGFADLDGHQWEVLYMDETQVQTM